MTALEKQVLNELQKGIPLVERPFLEIGQRIGISEEEVIDMVDSLKAKNYVRRFGGILDVNKLGINSTLIAMKVEEDIERVAGIINTYKGVTHNYERQDEYNLWFTLMEKSQEELEAVINEIKEKTKVNKMLCLPSVNKHKTAVFFRF
ncbi:MAG: Lrp/AsnC family transcriptional regulator [Bacillota bacterium]